MASNVFLTWRLPYSTQAMKVIVPAPYWVSYADIALVAGAKPVIIQCGIEQDFKLLPAQLEAAITPKTKLFMINSPSNPTGLCLYLGRIKGIGRSVEKTPACAGSY